THPTRAGADRRIEMQRGPDGIYRGQADNLPAGRWLVGVETDEWRLPALEIEGELRAVRIVATQSH
ncbi:MAG: FixH family protein, partial [Betaproteobacteria bacterium]